MGYPFSLEGEVPLPAAARQNLDAMLERLHGGLLGMQADDIAIEGRRLSFTFRLVSKLLGFHRVGVLDGGELEIHPDLPRITYRISTKRSFFVLMALPCIIGVISAANLRSPVGLVLFPLIGIASFSISYAVDRARVLALLRGTSFTEALFSRETGDTAGLAICPTCGFAYNDDDYEFGAEHYCEKCHNLLPAN